MEELIARLRKTPLGLALDHPVGTAIALSFVLMTLVVGIEQLEKGPPVFVWVRHHLAALALVKQVLCMASIPGFLLLMFWRSKKP